MKLIEEGKAAEKSIDDVIDWEMEHNVDGKRPIGEPIKGVHIQDLHKEKLKNRIKHRSEWNMHSDFIQNSGSDDDDAH